jgi:hypothetical protein
MGSVSVSSERLVQLLVIMGVVLCFVSLIIGATFLLLLCLLYSQRLLQRQLRVLRETQLHVRDHRCSVSHVE